MKIHIVAKGNRKDVLGLLNELMEAHGKDARVIDVMRLDEQSEPTIKVSDDGAFFSWLDGHEESLRVDDIIPKKAG